MARNNLSSGEKAAILMISLGRDYAAELYKHLTEDEISQLTLKITSTRRVDPEMREEIVTEFYEMCLAQKFISEGGIDYAREILEKAVGADKAYELIERLSSSLTLPPFDFIRKADATQVLNVINNEHPQTIALVLSHMDAQQSAHVLAELSPQLQTDIVQRIANMGSTSPEYVKETERILERKITSMGLMDQIAVGGIDAIVGIINSLDRGSERKILESLESLDSDLTDEIRKRMFVFEDIAKLPPAAIQKVVSKVDNSDLAIALKTATEDVKRVIFSNTSKRLQEMIKDDMEVMGPIRIKDVEEAQQRIVNHVRALDESGEIIVSRGKGDDIVV